MVYRGLITPEVLWPQDSALFAFSYRQDTTGNYMNTVILPNGREDYTSGTMMSYTGEEVLLCGETTNWFDSPLEVQISYLNSSYACGDLNASGRVDIADAVYSVSYIFSGGLPPADSSGGDLNCDGMVNIADAVYLLRYVMASGSPPCAACP